MRSYARPHAAVCHYLAIAAVLIAVCNSTEVGLTPEETGNTPSNVVDATVYYESLCFDSIQFVKNQLLPAYRDLKNFLSVTFVPYGKASHQRIVNSHGVEKWHFTCQHGPSECYGNKAQACALQDILTDPGRSDKQQDQVSLVGCVMSARNPSIAVPQCSETIGIDEQHRSQINNCIASTTGDDLLVSYGEKTFSVQPNINFVPTIVINGVFSHENQRNSLRNFKSTICNHISVEARPATCGV